MTLVEQSVHQPISQRLACSVLNVCRNTVRHHLHRQRFCGPIQPVNRCRKDSLQPRALNDRETAHIVTTMNSHEFCNQPPTQIYYALLERDERYCSISTMHRLLRQQNLHGERRLQRPSQSHAIPRLHAKSANEVWTWDITKLATIRRGQYLSLYVVMDLYSRYIVAWMVSRKENSALASQLMQEAIERYAIKPDTLTLHQDRGSPMTAHCYLDLLSELTVTASHSRPRVSNDNAMSESQFKTMKYQPDYPRQFEDYDHAQRWCQDYVHWYNTAHYHSALAGFTPQQAFTGEHLILVQQRQQTLDRSYEQHPERYTKGRPLAKKPPEDVYINPVPEGGDVGLESGVNFPTLKRANAI